MDVIKFPEKTTIGLSILLHGVISLPEATSYDKNYSGILCTAFLQALWHSFSFLLSNT